MCHRSESIGLDNLTKFLQVVSSAINSRANKSQDKSTYFVVAMLLHRNAAQFCNVSLLTSCVIVSLSVGSDVTPFPVLFVTDGFSPHRQVFFVCY